VFNFVRRSLYRREIILVLYPRYSRLDGAQRPSGPFGEHKTIYSPDGNRNHESSQSLHRLRNPGFSLYTEIMRKTNDLTFVASSQRTMNQRYSLQFCYSEPAVSEQGTESALLNRRKNLTLFLQTANLIKYSQGAFRKPPYFK
jgi:hypothetical protein